MSINETEDQRHYRREKAMGRAIEEMLVHVESYCIHYHMRFDNSVSSDYIMGLEGIKPILKGIHTLLNGPTGLLDCSKLSTRIHVLAREHGLLDKNGEL